MGHQSYVLGVLALCIPISLLQISLLSLFKTFHKYLPYANFGLFISLVQFLGKIFGCAMRFFGYLFHYWVIIGHVTQNVEFYFSAENVPLGYFKFAWHNMHYFI